MRKENDFYPTPASIVAAIKNNWVPPNGCIWEPCSGDGRIGFAFLESKYDVISGDIGTGQDFFNIRLAPAETLVTNPPFSKIRQFIDRAFDIGVKKMLLVCPERLWACKKGAEQFQRHRPSKWINLSWREDYLGKGGAPDRALAIAIWDSPCAEKCEYEIWDKP